MHIIFGDSLHLIPEKFTILELDTFEDGDKQETAWCVVENIPLGDFPTPESLIMNTLRRRKIGMDV